MAYAEVSDFQERATHALSKSEQQVVETLLEDAANIIDCEYARHGKTAPCEGIGATALRRVSVEMVQRAMSTAKQGGDDWQAGAGQEPFVSESWYDGNGEMRLTAQNRRELGLARTATRAAFVSCEQ